jgi:hypothetical protein
MEYLIHARSSLKKKYLEHILPKMLKDLKLEKSRKCLVVTLEKDCEDLGCTVNFDAIHGYIVVLRSTQSIASLGVTLAHELVHVKQMAIGKLKTTTQGAHFWAGVRYKKSTPYYSRPWELDAFSKQEMVFRRAIEDILESKPVDISDKWLYNNGIR